MCVVFVSVSTPFSPKPKATHTWKIQPGTNDSYVVINIVMKSSPLRRSAKRKKHKIKDVYGLSDNIKP